VDDRDARELLERFGTFVDQFGVCFNRRPQREAARRYLDGLFNDSERKSMQAMHGRLSDPATYQALQHFVTDSPWEADALWTRLRAVVPTREGLLAVDDTGLPKQGRHSPGVQRQYCGALGKIGNCQVAVSTVLLANGLTWPLSCDLYVPQTWIADPERCARAGIPETTRFREKWRIALTQIRRAMTAGFTITAVVADTDYGSTAAFRRGLEHRGLRYAVAIRGCVTVWIAGARRALPVSEVATAVPEPAWQRVEWGIGTKGPLAARFAAYRVRPAKSRGDRWLLCERSLATDERKYYLLNLDETAPLRDLVRLARSRWPIEQQYRELKDELGFDHFEGRTYRGWTHHVVLTAIAFTFLQVERQQNAHGTRPTLPTVRLWVREIMGVLYIINTRRVLNLIESFRRNPPLRR
jgi:SRSO17 transposase